MINLKQFNWLYYLSSISMVACLYSTKTAYLDSFTDPQLAFINRPQNYLIKDCEPEQIYMVVRHGARYPSAIQIAKSKDFLADVRQYRSNQNFTKKNLLDEVVFTFGDTVPNDLSDIGRQELKTIAERFKKRYPKLFANETNISVVSSYKDRSIDSARSFLQQILEEADYLSALNRIRIDNRLMRSFDECKQYVEGVKKNSSALNELILFEKSQHVNELITRLKIRHDIVDFEGFDINLLKKLFTLCDIENAHRMPINWCKLFTSEDQHLFSYLTDLKQYWEKSYGNKANTKPVFLLIQDLFNEMKKHINDSDHKHSALLRFGHAENIIPLITALGLFSTSEKLKSDNFEAQDRRRFRVSTFSPFSSNVAFVLNKCAYDYKINLLVNELPITESSAGSLKCATEENGSNLCSLSELEMQLREYLEYEFDRDCQVLDDHDHVSENKMEL